MFHPITLAIARHAVVCALITATWLLLYHMQPAVTNSLAVLIKQHVRALGVLLVFTVIAVDMRIVAFRNAVGMRTVGVKARAQEILGGR
jgi:multisubunit Na+/H+ antiporter MnhC subunit